MKKVASHHYSGDELNESIKIVRLEARSPYDNSAMHRHNYNEMFLFVKGGGTHMIDYVTHEIENHCFHIVTSNKIHLVDRVTDSRGYVILFKDDFLLDNLMNQKVDFAFMLDSAIINLSEDVFNNLLEIVGQIESDAKSTLPIHKEITQTRLHLLLLQLKQFVRTHPEQFPVQLMENNLYRNFYLLLEENFKEEHSANFYAGKLNMSDALLSKNLKEITHKSTKNIIQERLFLEAKRLLNHSDLSTKEIAFYLNFSDAAHFSNFFKSMGNESPTSFRDSIKG